MSLYYVQIYYGPCDSFFTMSHKPQKLAGLRDALRRSGYRVDLVPVDHVNYCMLEMCGHEVFRCNIKNLQFNTPAEQDAVCQRAIDAVITHRIKFNRSREYLWFADLLEDQIFKRGKYASKDFWPFQVQIEQFSSCKDCSTCCVWTKKKNEKLPWGTIKPFDKIMYNFENPLGK